MNPESIMHFNFSVSQPLVTGFDYSADIDNEMASELNEGIRLLKEREGIDRQALKLRFDKFENRIERKIYLQHSFSNHLIELNRQLRSAAALFLIGITFSFLIMGNLSAQESIGYQQSSGPYDLALGSKVAP